MRICSLRITLKSEKERNATRGQKHQVKDEFKVQIPH